MIKTPISNEAVGSFPIIDLLPKHETGILDFLTKYPNYDGRNTVIAILDSGVDPGAPGLQRTSDGRVKIIHRFDCSGCGDVDTSVIVEPTNCLIKGLTGRTLKIPNAWRNPTNKYHIGIKYAYDLYPARLKERMKSEYRERYWVPRHRQICADISRLLEEFDTDDEDDDSSNYGAATSNSVFNTEHIINNVIVSTFYNQYHHDGDNDDDDDDPYNHNQESIIHNDLNHTSIRNADHKILQKEDLEAKLDMLNLFEKRFYDAGPIYDCIVFHDGTKWLCCVDTSENGDLDMCTLLGEYSVTYQYCRLTKSDNFNYSFNIYNDGNLLELVGLCSSHGTHVASIAASYFSEQPERNGIAPGAQLISLTIGDGRLGTMETGTAIVRALIQIMRFCEDGGGKPNVDVINMSYGEYSQFSDFGIITELIDKVVNKYGVVWVASAGNVGPALNTVGTPLDIAESAVIGVGAYVSPEMMLTAYSMSDKLPGMPFTWSSRGPCSNGALGVSVCAPGGAVTSVPNCTLKCTQLMNGTSMSAPHVAGAVALLITAAKQNNFHYSPYSIRRAIENTAYFLDGIETYAQGTGLLDMMRCYQHFCDYHNAMECKVYFTINCMPGNTKGIYIRDKQQTNQYVYTISVVPKFIDTDNVTADIKIRFNMRLQLRSSHNVEYITYPSHLDLSNTLRTFSIQINMAHLLPGLYTVSIDAYDSMCINKGPVFKIPVTVIQPEQVQQPKYVLRYERIHFQPNTIRRHFIHVPVHATWAVVKLSASNPDSMGRFAIHCLQILPRQSCRVIKLNRIINVTSNCDASLALHVRGNHTLEVTIAKFWANFGDLALNYSVMFFGTKPNQMHITMAAANGVKCIEVTSLQGEDILPVITLKNAVQVLKPNERSIGVVTGERDVIPPSRQIYHLLLTYQFNIAKCTEISPNASMFSCVLYESEFVSQLWQLYDINKQLIGCGDAYPNKYWLRVEKGDYILRLHVRHENKEILEKFKDVPLLIQQKLNNPIVLDVYNSYSQAVIGSKKATVVQSLHSSVVPFYIAPLPTDKLPIKGNNSAQYLNGTITFCGDDIGRQVDTYPFQYILANTIPICSSPKHKSGSDQMNANNSNINSNIGAVTNWRECNNSIRNTRLQLLANIEKHMTISVFDSFYHEYCDEYQFHLTFLQAMEPLTFKSSLPPALNIVYDPVLHNYKTQMYIIDICHKLAQILFTCNIAEDYVEHQDVEDPMELIQKYKLMYLEAICRKGIALCRLYYIKTELEDKKEILQFVADLWKLIKRTAHGIVEKSYPIYMVYFIMWHSCVFKFYGRLLKYIMRLQDEKRSEDLEIRLMEMTDKLKWYHISENIKRNLPSKFPLTFRPV